MLLYFRSADLHYTAAADFCAALRHAGQLVCLPNPDEPPETLSALPFTAAIFHFEHAPDGLPHPRALRACFPNIPIIALGKSNADPTRWRAIPDTDYELLDPVPDFAALLSLTEHLRTKQNRTPIQRCSLDLAHDRRHVTVLVHRIAFTPDEYALLRVFASAQNPLNAALLSGFLARPGNRHPAATVPVLVMRINKKATAHNAPRLIACQRNVGYHLCAPYSQILPKDRVHILSPRG